MEFTIGVYIASILFTCALVSADDVQSSNSTEHNETITCLGKNDVPDININNVTGKWKTVELYLHLSKEGVHMYNSCPIITIWESDQMPTTTFGPSTENQLFHVQHINAKFRQQYRHLRLLWDEAGQTTEYALYFRNESAGYWQVFNGQNGTMTTNPLYQQFSGTVQVLKAVNDHLVLNFCQEARNGRPAQLYSVLFSRDPGTMSRLDIDSVHMLLQNKKLSVASRRLVCGNSAIKPLHSIFLLALLLIVNVLRSL